MKTLLPLVLLATVLAVGGSAQKLTVPRDHKLAGVIKDQNAAVIPGLLLELNKNGVTKSLSTDINGEFDISLAAGDWELTANRISAQNFRVFVRIGDTEMNPAHLELVVDSALLCCTSPTGKLYPKIIRFPYPAYPATALVAGARGQVAIAVKIGKDGKVVDATMESGNLLLKASSIKAARDCLFEPSESKETREAQITYHFIPGREMSLMKEIKRYKDLYTANVELSAVVDTFGK